MSNCRATKRVNGITLIELLVGVMIVMVTASIVAPVVKSRVIESRGTPHTFKNFAAINTAFNLYLMDWGSYPPAHNLHNDIPSWEPASFHTGGPGGAAAPFWWEALMPYVWTPLIFKDPMDKGVGESFGTGYDSMYDYWAAKLTTSPWNRPPNADDGRALSCSYVYNGALGWTDLWQLYQKGQLPSWRPSAGSFYHYRTVPSAGGGPSPKTYASITRPDARYLVWGWIGFWWRGRDMNGYSVSGAWPVLFCDGHTKMVNWYDFDETGAGLPTSEIVVSWYVPVEMDLAP